MPMATVPRKTIKYRFSRGKNRRFDSDKSKKSNKKCRWPLCREKRLSIVFREVRTGGSTPTSLKKATKNADGHCAEKND